jgi:hypothetical protein
MNRAHTAQGKRADKFTQMRTLDDFEELAEKERKAVAKRARVILAGGAAEGQGATPPTATSVVLDLDRGSGRRLGKAVVGAAVADISEGGATGEVSFAFILWGFSQKVQIQGAFLLV